MLKNRLSISLLLAVAALTVLFVAGCGSGSGEGGGSSSSGAEPASLAAPGSVVFVEGNLRPSGELKTNADAVAKQIAGIDNLGEFIVSELESSAEGKGESVNFATEVEPWLGKVAAVAFRRLEGEELSEPLIAVQTTNPKEAKAFIEKRANQSSKAYKRGSYKGSNFEVGGTEGNAMGVVGEWAVIADGEKEFKAAVDAYNGESLADESRFQDAISNASEGSLADIYVDVGALIEQSGEKNTDSQVQEILESSGVDPSKATAVASVIPGAEEITVDLSSDLGGKKAPSGDVSELLGSAPADSFAAFAVAGFGAQLEEAIDSIDESGVPPDLEPGELKKTLNQAGLDVDKIAASLEEAVVFAEGSNRDNLGGAVIVAADSPEAAEAVASFGALLRGAKVPGITAVSGNASGFSVHSSELGEKPLVVVGKGTRIAIGYGLSQALKGLNPGSGTTLADTPNYKAGVSSLGKTPISAYADGPAVLKLAEALVPRSKKDFWEAQPYLKKIAYLALGSGTGEDPATATLIAGLSK